MLYNNPATNALFIRPIFCVIAGQIQQLKGLPMKILAELLKQDLYRQTSPWSVVVLKIYSNKVANMLDYYSTDKTTVINYRT